VSAELAHRTPHRIEANARRVIARLFVPGEEQPGSRSRANAVLLRVLALSEEEVTELVDSVIAGFRGRHRDLMGAFTDHFTVVDLESAGVRRISAERRMLVGACFTQEYAPEGAALFNPSMTAHPDQSGLAEGEARFLMTVRCLGEGHISSIGFRTGIVGPGYALRIDETTALLSAGRARPATFFQRDPFLARVADLGSDTEDAEILIRGLPETFTPDQLSDRLTAIHEHTLNRQRGQTAVDMINRVVSTTYDVAFDEGTSLSERLLWPTAAVESRGMEDARLVRFTEDDGDVTYYATYTAYDGTNVTPQLFATKDFRQFHISAVAGRAAQNKGLCLFPRRIDGKYVALSRWDRESTSLCISDDLRIWTRSRPVHTPRHGWEVIQVGNCGPPIETTDGWLVLTHGVGPMRVYGIGAMLLDLADPSVVLATLRRPLMTANSSERDGYVPNVVYSCGALLHQGVLTIPYGISDRAIGFAQAHVSELLGHMDSQPSEAGT
jgi:predicted GH43/DUF377 family glycosyl hydrolase